MAIIWALLAALAGIFGVMGASPAHATIPNTGEALELLGIVAAWNTLPVVGQVVTAAMGLSFIASWVTALTPTPVDDEYAGRAKKWTTKAYRLIELAGGKTSLAKQQGSVSQAVNEAARVYSKADGILDKIEIAETVADTLGQVFGSGKTKGPSVAPSNLEGK